MTSPAPDAAISPKAIECTVVPVAPVVRLVEDDEGILNFVAVAVRTG